MNRISPLLRHFRLQWVLRLARLSEHIAGWQRGIRWVPTVVQAWQRGRFRGSKVDDPEDGYSGVEGTADFPVFYINLDHRDDRKSETLLEFAGIKIDGAVRVAAIGETNGALGCARSHISVLEGLHATNFKLAMICEDDVEFLVSRGHLNKVLWDFQNREGVGVLCLANRVRGPRFRISKHLAIANNIQTTACYVVKPSSVGPLLDSFNESAKGLAAGGSAPEFAIDQTWKKLQDEHMFFAVPRSRIAQQRKSYSDIEKKIKFYGGR